MLKMRRGTCAPPWWRLPIRSPASPSDICACPCRERLICSTHSLYCCRIGYWRTAKLFSAEASGLIVKLTGWHYPAVIDTASGEVKFDNYNGHWGKQQELDKLLQAYAVEKACAQARRLGNTVTEQALADGSIKLTIQVGSQIGGAA